MAELSLRFQCRANEDAYVSERLPHTLHKIQTYGTMTIEELEKSGILPPNLLQRTKTQRSKAWHSMPQEVFVSFLHSVSLRISLNCSACIPRACSVAIDLPHYFSRPRWLALQRRPLNCGSMIIQTKTRASK